MTRPAVSQHLKLLKTAGLVRDHAEGTRRIYRANPDGLLELRMQLDRFWSQTLANFKQLVDHPRRTHDLPGPGHDREPGGLGHQRARLAMSFTPVARLTRHKPTRGDRHAGSRQ